MKTKTWKLGEVCKGGVITVEIKDLNITIIGKEWDYSKGSRKSSNQSNAKEFTRTTVRSTGSNAENELDMLLCDLTTSYHSGNIIKWIKSKLPFASKPMW